MTILRKMNIYKFVGALYVLSLSVNVMANSATNLNAIYHDVLKEMPTELINYLPAKLKIKLEKLNQEQANICSNIPEKYHYASYNDWTNTISLAKSLYASLVSCNDKALAIIKKKIAHELFHAYDMNKDSEYEKVDGCNSRRLHHPKRKTSTLCRKVIKNSKRQGFISDDIRFKNIAQLQGRSQETFKGKRTLNPYELTNQYEFSATNFEAFIYDTEYKCRRPSLYGYFSSALKHKPYKNEVCDSANYIIPESGIANKIKVDPSRIYQIHYLSASKGEAVMSRFGHSMLRFIVCAPERKDKLTGITVPATKFGKECMGDLDYHFVATYRAEIAENSLDHWGGIKGKYPSNLYITSLKKVMKEYNEDELRDLDSYPLILSDEEKNKLIERTLESYWDYKGSYKFFTNNCATETYNLITGVTTDLKTHLDRSLTPNGILRDLARNGLVDLNPEAEEDLKKYYFFKSKRGSLARVVKNLSDAGFEFTTFETYIGKSPGDRRLILESTLNKILSGDYSRKKTIQLISSMMVLERRGYTVAANNLWARQSMLFYNLSNSSDAAVKETMARFNVNSQHILSSTYGIPSSTEFELIQHRVNEVDVEAAQNYFGSQLEGKFIEEINDVEQSMENFLFLNKAKREFKKRNK